MIASNICPIDGSAAAAAAALAETDRFAVISGLEGKEALHLRLLAEELLGMVNGVTQIWDGSFMIEKSWGAYQLQLSARVAPMGEEAERRLLRTASSGENEFYRGVTGKLRLVSDWFSSGAELSALDDPYVSGGMLAAGEISDWSLERMRQCMERERRAQEWDELERSVLSRLADDVQVGLRYEKVVVTVYKAFS